MNKPAKTDDMRRLRDAHCNRQAELLSIDETLDPGALWLEWLEVGPNRYFTYQGEQHEAETLARLTAYTNQEWREAAKRFYACSGDVFGYIFHRVNTNITDEYHQDVRLTLEQTQELYRKLGIKKYEEGTNKQYLSGTMHGQPFCIEDIKFASMFRIGGDGWRWLLDQPCLFFCDGIDWGVPLGVTKKGNV